MIVSNSSPIIALAKQGRLNILKECFQKVLIPKEVHREIIQKKDLVEIIDFEKAIKEGWLIVEDDKIIPPLNTKIIGNGEKGAISLAIKHKSLLIMDDDSAKKYASIFRIEVHGTFFVIYLACLRKLIDKNEAINILKKMIKDGFYISSETYSRFLELFNSL